jgi:hypothetical protein
MSQLKRYACQLAKILSGAPIVIFAFLAIFAFSAVAGNVLVYLLDNFWIVRVIGCLFLVLIMSGAAFLVGDDLFRKYDICQRFK